MKRRELLLFCLVSFLLPTRVYADSSYVLPYPGVMPGSVWYKMHQVQERLEAYWYYGSFGQLSYHIQQADKYLVEAKTLFEYKQYLLGAQALERSNTYFVKIPSFLIQAQREGKVISDKKIILENASLKHREVLAKMKQDIPRRVDWSPEKESTTELDLHHMIDTSISIRKNISL
jgi:hypothetical protein